MTSFCDCTASLRAGSRSGQSRGTSSLITITNLDKEQFNFIPPGSGRTVGSFSFYRDFPHITLDGRTDPHYKRANPDPTFDTTIEKNVDPAIVVGEKI